METSKIIRELRLNKDMSQLDLAKYIGISQSAIAKIEIGKNEPTASTLKKIADYFDVSTDYILGRENEEGNIITVAPDLSDEEQRLIDYYRALPIDLRAAVVSYAQTFFELDTNAKNKRKSNS